MLLASPHDPEHVRTAARDILGRSQFQEPAVNRIGDVVNWVLDHIFPKELRSSLGGGPGFIGDLVVLALLCGVAYLLYRVVRGWRPRVKPDIPEAQLTIDVDERRTADEWAALAERLAAERQFREAVRARYGELVARLADDGSVATIAGRTSGEYRRDVARSRPSGAEPFDEASAEFERVWYGGDDADAADVERVRSLGARVLTSQRAREPVHA